MPIPIETHPAPAGHRPRLHPRSWPTRSATSSTSSPARRRGRASPTGARRSRSACRSRRSTSTWTRTPTSSRCSFSFDSDRQASCRSSSSRTEQTKVADPDPDPGHHAAQPAARARSRRSRPSIEPIDEHREVCRRCRAALIGLAKAAQLADAVTATGTLDVLRYGRVLKARAAGRRARRGHGLRRPLLRQERHPQHQARRVQAELHADPQRPDLDRPDGAGMSDRSRRVLRQVPRHGGQQHRPACRWAASRRMVPDVLGVAAVELGDAVRAGRGHADGHVHACRRSAPASGSSSSRATPTTRSGPAASGASPAEVPALARTVPPGAARHHAADDRCRTASSISDVPGPTGGIMLKSTTGATIIVNDTGIYIQNGKGAIDHHDRPDGHHQQRRADGDLTWRCPCPASCPPRRDGASARTAGRRSRPRRTRGCWSAGSRSSTLAAPVRGRRLRRSPPPGGNGPCVTAQWVDRRDARPRRRRSRCVLQDSQAVCAPTGTPLIVVVTQTARDRRT